VFSSKEMRKAQKMMHHLHIAKKTISTE